MKTWIAVIVAVVIVLLAIVLLETRHSPLSLFGSQGLSVSTSTITASTTDYTVDASYPQFGIPAIDAQIKASVVAGKNDLITEAQQDKPTESGYGPYYFDCGWGSPYEDADYVSASIVCGTFTDGAHENPVIIGATYDRATGKPVTLDQALALTGMTLDQVASSTKAQLAENPDTAPTGMWASGSDPVAANYQTFLINANAVAFIFQPYQVAPFSSGAPEVSIPRIK